jgi:hypothetical protein
VDLVEFGVTFPFYRFDGSRNIWAALRVGRT